MGVHFGAFLALLTYFSDDLGVLSLRYDGLSTGVVTRLYQDFVLQTGSLFARADAR